YPRGLTVGPDGNLWLAAESVLGTFVIGRITPAGALPQVPPRSFYGSSGGLTGGPGGRPLVPASPPPKIRGNGPTPARVTGVTGVAAVANWKGAITSILVGFDEALDPASARKDRFYGLAAGVERGPTIVYSKRVKIARVSYDRAAHAVRLRLAVPQKGPVQVTTRAGLVAADGMSSFSDFTEV